MKKNQFELPESLPEGHGGTYKKGMAEALLRDVTTELGHTPHGHELSRAKGAEAGEAIAKEIARIVKKPLRGER